jgi:hypothetical protein
LGKPMLVRPEIPRGKRRVATRLTGHLDQPGSPYTDRHR